MWLKNTCVVLLSFFLCNTEGYCQSENDAASAASKLAGPVRVASILWKTNPSLAENTLRTAIESGLQQDTPVGVGQALAKLHTPAMELLQRDDASRDKRYVVAIAIDVLCSAMSPEWLWDDFESRLHDIPDIASRGWALRVALAVRPEESFQYIGQSLLNESENRDNNEAWLTAVVQECLTADVRRGAEMVLANWGSLPNSAQAVAIEPMTANAQAMTQLLASVSVQKVDKNLINTNQLRKWVQSDIPSIKESIESIWGTVRIDGNTPREQLVSQLASKIDAGATGSYAGGKLVFARVCAQCHLLNGQGYEVGPDLAGNGRGNLKQLISNILDPSLVIGPAFQAQTILTVDGDVASGILIAETEDAIRLKVQGGKTLRFSREDIEEVRKSEKSLMPEGIELQTTEQELLDLIAYLSVVDVDGEKRLIPEVPEGFVGE